VGLISTIPTNSSGKPTTTPWAAVRPSAKAFLSSSVCSWAWSFRYIDKSTDNGRTKPYFHGFCFATGTGGQHWHCPDGASNCRLEDRWSANPPLPEITELGQNLKRVNDELLALEEEWLTLSSQIDMAAN
jgi:hypothetical protein